MKAKVKETGEIVEVHYSFGDDCDYEEFDFPHPRRWKAEELFTPEDFHWQNVRERAAITAMQAIIPTQKGEYMICDAHRRFEDCAETAVYYADALVKLLKKKQL